MLSETAITPLISRRNQYLFIGGNGISIIGTALYTFAISLYVLNTTGSSQQFAITLALGVMPRVLLSPIAGVILDRTDKKRMAVIMDIVNIIWMAILLALPTLSITAIYAVTFGVNVTSVFYGMASEIMKPMIVMPEELIHLNGVAKVIDGLASVVAPLMGGVLILSMSIKTFILANAVSFGISAVCTAAMQLRREAEKTHEIQRFGTALKEGIAYLFADTNMRYMFLVFLNLNFYLGIAVEVPIPVILNQIFEVTPKAYGFVNSGFPIGLVIGALMLERFNPHMQIWCLLKRMNALMTLVIVCMALPLIGVFQIAVTPYYFTLMTALGFCISYVDITIMVYLQTEVPAAIRGRVLGIMMSFVKLILPIGLVLSGILTARMPVAYVVLMGAAVAFVTNVMIRNVKSS
ncbi:MFS transporter [Fusibacter paucivorans]|uniref:MFS transporter n=1 Tax=Fusibacter paucivorans TaxID=76009 RepID=A0ABS5PMF7_9FIRM|nr:MFS transporter [Fusibacter paucivorans]MBS7525546.1 MFS transporter [Fusibacter paucivorans]